ncbi:hypothetical protein N0V95_005652 [Ascochyta clinopodiicola]|nr:hypothetical protein N0V95_005652 [Ascochyta clinopodiicola]
MQSEPNASDIASKDAYKEPSHQVNPSDHDTEERQHLTGFKLAIVLGSLTLAIPQITTEFNALADVGWYIGAYSLAAATFQPLSGKLYTHFSNKSTYLTFTLLFELGSLVCGLATSSSMFIAGRLIAGLGAAGLFNGSFTILSSAVPLDKSPLYTGMLAGVSQLGIVAGPLAVKGEGPTLSGVHILPSILSALLFVVATGAAITKLGYYLPWGVVCGILTAVGAGLVSTWTPTTSVAQWVGYQIIFGAGRGAGMQVPIVAVQNAVKPAQIPIAMAVLIFFQNFSTSVAGVISNTIFAQTLTARITQYAPLVSPSEALKSGSGASTVRALVPAGHEDELDGVLKAYSDSLQNVFYFLVGLAVLATLVSFGMGWKDVRRKGVSTVEKVQTAEKGEEV